MLTLAAARTLAADSLTAAGTPAGAGAGQTPSATLPPAGPEDYTTPVGFMEDGALHVRLKAGSAVWQPWGDDGPELVAYVFSADGAPPRVPAPLIRVRAGTPVHVTLRNGFDRSLTVFGLHDRQPRATPLPPGPGLPAADSTVIQPGDEAVIRFTPTVPGTFVFRGSVHGAAIDAGAALHSTEGANRSFVGVLIVDAPDEAPIPGERVFLITHWMDPALPASFLPATRFFINGRSWPNTERLDVALHDTLHWRVINFSGRPHPMHLHGFYFHVGARGDLRSENVYSPEERRLVVTELLAPAQSMRMSWVAEEPGNWIFHCHLMRHMSHHQRAPLAAAPAPPPAHPDHDGAAAHGHGMEAGDPVVTHPAEDADLMGGLVLGITVTPPSGWRATPAPRRRRLDLHITRRDAVFGDAPGYGFVLQEGSRAPAADSVRFPGSTLTLRRGEPTTIMVHNRADVPLGVHWHGIELESRSDGVPGWSGMPDTPVPAIRPGDSLEVRITPRRAGTFMYHVHSEPGHQLALGLHGALIVNRPDDDTSRDVPFLLGSLGHGDDAPPAINGVHEHAPIELEAGQTYRMRFMHISPDDDKRIALLSGRRPVEWRAIAVDGADLPIHQRRSSPADLRIAVGQTFDFEWTPAPGVYTLRVTTTFDSGAPLFPRPAPPPHTADVTIVITP